MNIKKILIKDGLFLKLTYIFVISIILFYGFKDALIELYGRLYAEERYSHGFIIPFVVGYLIYQKRLLLKQADFIQSRIGVLIVLLAISVLIIGKISALWTVVQYALFFIIIGILLSYMGWQALKIIIAPLFLLLLSIPLPYFIDVLLSGKFQLLSSKLGVDIIRYCNIPVFLEGNVIDLGVYKLQVIEACSGLNYLYPLMSIGVIIAYMYNDSTWKKVLIFLSTIPITILMNSFRIAMIALLVDNYGIAMAEGILHDFEGWVVYMICIVILIIEIKLLSNGKLSDLLLLHDVNENVDKEKYNSSNYKNKKSINWPLSTSSALIIFSVILLSTFSHENEIIPARKSFSLFPSLLGDKWNGKQEYFINNEQSKLGVTDYLLSNYLIDGKVVNLYIGYHESQRTGTSPHSPRACIPGNGWEITSIENLSLKDQDNQEFYANKLMIQKGETKQLVYYWFQQRGRKIANEFVMKWYLFKDALLLNRTDGALVRLTTMVNPGESLDFADQRLQAFAKEVLPVLPQYIPE